MAVALAIGAPGASAAAEIIAPQHHPPEADDGWQAGTCFSDTPTSCSVDTPAQFFEQAAGHPQVGFTQFIIKHTTTEVGPVKFEEPVGDIKTVRVDLPAGLSVNPEATPQCEQATFETTPLACPSGSNVGTSFAVAALAGVVSPQVPATVYNIEPPPGEPARFGFNLLGNNVYLRAGVAWDGNYHEYFTIDAPTSPIGHVLKNRLVFEGRKGNGTFITTPTTCFDWTQPQFKSVYSTFLRADGLGEFEDPNFPNGSPFIESELPPNTSPKECQSIPFKPTTSVSPGTAQTDSPAGAEVDVAVPFEVPSALEIAQPLTKQASSQLRTAKLTLPQGMGINPSAANGLATCTNDQFKKDTRSLANSCPPSSKIGTVAVDTPPLPDGSLNGDVYVGQQLSRDPASGDEYRIFVEARSDRYGIIARLIGNVSANPQTGQLTTTFAENPQVPFSSFRLKFNAGPRAPLTSPPTCGPNQAGSQMIPWSGNAAATPGDKFTLTSAPGGGPCSKSLAERPFGPSFAANTTNPKGGAFTHFAMNIARSDGNQELKGVDVTLPPGLTAKLAGVRYCPEATIAAAAANSGAAEAASSSCPKSSLVGSAAIAAGSGSDPFHTTGKAFLAGRYHGAPLSLAVITPATAGPFDLGSVVVRVALFVDPSTAQVHAVSDPIPHVFGGALLDIRSIAVTIDRPKFALNPTNCSPMSVGGTLRGGGANPLDPAAFSSFPVSVPFKVNGCEGLGFKPKLYMRTFGGTRRAKSPKLRAVLIAREGDANIGRAAVTLPRAMFLEQSSLANVCTRVQFAANDCPKDSVYGYARAYTPLLDGPLKGPVYLRSSDNELPDMVAALHGQVDIDLDGRIDSVNGRLRNTFAIVPDVAVSKFILTVRGGKHGLLVNSRNLCAHKYKVLARFTAQNGKKANQRPKLRAPCNKRRRS
ncbi:MAG TPA: hypothetical protein VHR65_09075 [Solirubrobacterales bacterium]|nr:hypothetical protein [Solirubrobacterales bacterium]